MIGRLKADGGSGREPIRITHLVASQAKLAIFRASATSEAGTVLSSPSLVRTVTSTFSVAGVMPGPH